MKIPKYGIFENINSLWELAQMPQWTPEKPLRLAPKFMKENGLKHVTCSTTDGALEAAPPAVRVASFLHLCIFDNCIQLCDPFLSF
ncbi:ATP phosphoribosyltransferase 1, chloroplastic-like [Rhododendron vialii]|uniref:ATP phosphoribosyltransferase 1, chloroplastic-like n=1 Tax=Rhododendron vialii TaxID=182163 RepID=UPI00265FC2CF|nr:ATP phosphoribosyltransferase 1, chloroplastic-like [Rhododendron vialii]